MSAYQIIHKGVISTAEPTEGAWYCGMVKDGFEEGVDRDGVIAQYVGNGEFYEEGRDEPTDMGDYDYLAAQ